MTAETLAPARPRRLKLSFANQIIVVLCLMYLVMYIDRVNIATMAPQMMAELGLSNTQFGLAISAFSYPYALIQLFGGWISDRLGARRTLLACGAIVCAATFVTGLVGGLASLVAVRLALGFGEGFAFPTATRAIALWVPQPRWGMGQGITHGASRLGNALTPALVVSLMAYMSWRGAYVVFGLLMLAWVALWYWIAPRDRAAAGAPAAADPTPAVIPWWRLARRMAPVTAVDFCYGWTLWVFLTWLPSFFFKSFHLDLTHSALFASGVLLGGVAGDTVGGLLSDWIYRRTGSLQAARRNVIIVGMLGAFVFLLPVVLTHELETVAICLSLACFFSELVVGPIWTVPMDIAPRHAGTASGMMNFGFGFAGIVSPLVFGFLLDVTGGWTVPFCGSLALLLVGAGLSFLMRPDLPFEEAVSA